MKGLKKIALASAIAAISAGAQAELKALDDSTMGEMTGQAGLTIDVSTKWQLGEFMYQDSNNAAQNGGSVVIQNITLGGSTSSQEAAWNTANPNAASNGYLDNYRLYLDVAGGGGTNGDNNLQFGMSTNSALSTIIVFANGVGTGAAAAAGAPNGMDQNDWNELVSNSSFYAAIAATNRGGPIDMDRRGLNGQFMLVDQKRIYGDGDLVIKSTFTDPWQKGGGFDDYAAGTGDSVFNNGSNDTSIAELTYSNANTIMSKSVDFNFSFEVLGLASSAYNAGDAADTSIATVGRQASDRGAGFGSVIHKAQNGYDTDGAGTAYTQRGNSGIDPDSTTTTLISDLSINGYFGPSEFILRNRGNGFGLNDVANLTDDDISADSTYAWGVANSGIETSRYISITDLDVYIDIAGVAIKDLKIHNERGDKSGLNVQEIRDGAGNVVLSETTSSYGFAHSSRDINAVKDDVLDLGRSLAAAGYNPAAFVARTVGVDMRTAARQDNYTDGIRFHNRFKGDIDIPHLSFGNDGRTIGGIYLTDYQNDTYLTISAH